MPNSKQPVCRCVHFKLTDHLVLLFEFNIEKSRTEKSNNYGQQLRCNERPIRGNVTIN